MKGSELLAFLQKISPEVLAESNVYFDSKENVEQYDNVNDICVDKIGDIILIG